MQPVTTREGGACLAADENAPVQDIGRCVTGFETAPYAGSLRAWLLIRLRRLRPQAQLDAVGEGFEVVPRRELDGALEKTFWIQSGMWERFYYDSNYNIFWGQNGTLRSSHRRSPGSPS